MNEKEEEFDLEGTDIRVLERCQEEIRKILKKIRDSRKGEN